MAFVTVFAVIMLHCESVILSSGLQLLRFMWGVLCSQCLSATWASDPKWWQNGPKPFFFQEEIISIVLSGAFTLFSLSLFFFCSRGDRYMHVYRWLHTFADIMFTFGVGTEHRVHGSSLWFCVVLHPLCHQSFKAGLDIEVDSVDMD